MSGIADTEIWAESMTSRLSKGIIYIGHKIYPYSLVSTRNERRHGRKILIVGNMGNLASLVHFQYLSLFTS